MTDDNKKLSSDTEVVYISDTKLRKRHRRVRYVLFFVCGMLTAIGLLFLVFAFPPLRKYVPGYFDPYKRSILIQSAMRIDSLEHENDLRAAYLDNLVAVLKGEGQTEAVQPYDSSVQVFRDTSSLVASARETAFVTGYEEQEQFALNILHRHGAGHQSPTFLTPVKGELLSTMSDGETAVRITCVGLADEMPVLAPAEGTVIQCTYLMDQGFQVVLQHGDDYVSIFSHLTSVMVEGGETLMPGQVMGHAGSKPSGETNVAASDSIMTSRILPDSWVGIQVWHRGNWVDPVALMSL